MMSVKSGAFGKSRPCKAMLRAKVSDHGHDINNMTGATDYDLDGERTNDETDGWRNVSVDIDEVWHALRRLTEPADCANA